MTDAPTQGPIDALPELLAGKFRIVRKLGEGGWGSVYEAENVRIRRRVAIKTLHPTHARKGDAVARFEREAIAASQAGNAHIVEVLDLGPLDDGGVFMVQEYLPGRDLEAALEAGGPWPLDRTAHVICQVCEALSAAHAKGIVHRDLKPSNVFLIERDGDPDYVKVLDFGIAKFVGDDPGSSGAQKMTRTGMALGTPYFMSPEQIEGRRDVDHRTDLYALGVMLYFMLSGRYPYDADTFPMLAARIVATDAADVATLRPDLPPAVSGLIMSLLHKDATQRPPDAASIRNLLAPFRVRAGTEPGTTPRVVQVSADPVRPLPESTQRLAPPPVATAVAPQKLPVGLIVGVPLFAVVVALGLASYAIVRATQRNGEAPAPAAVPPAVASVSPPASAQTVHVTVATDPPDAVLRLDGQPLANPFDGDLPLSHLPRRIEASMPGYVGVTRDLVLDVSQRISLPLARAPDHRTSGSVVTPSAHPSAPSGALPPAVAPPPAQNPSAPPVEVPAAVRAQPAPAERPAASTAVPTPEPQAPSHAAAPAHAESALERAAGETAPTERQF